MNNNCPDSPFILASSSIYRANLLNRLCICFQTMAPHINETKLSGETPCDYVKRLSIQKAIKISEQHPEFWVIGSDQTAVFQGQIIGKPGNRENAVNQLEQFSGQTVEFITGVSLVNQKKSLTLYQESITKVYFKKLSQETICHYLDKDQPYDCAGSFKVESLGVMLFDKVTSEDPTSLEGLPLISLCKLFAKAGINLSDYFVG